jgi:CheY-like chemotaxis protein
LRGETILLVEDSDSLREVTKEFLVIAGFRVEDATNGEAALRLAGSHKDPIHLLLTDVVMPGISGPEVARRMKELHPETRILFMSGYTQDAIVHHGVLDEGIRLLTKPFTRASLTRKVQEVLNS